MWLMGNYLSYSLSYLCNGQTLFRTHIIKPAEFPRKEDGPQPDVQVCGVEVGTARSPIPLNDNWPTLQAIADKGADDKVNIQWQIQPTKAPATGGQKRSNLTKIGSLIRL